MCFHAVSAVTRCIGMVNAQWCMVNRGGVPASCHPNVFRSWLSNSCCGDLFVDGTLASWPSLRGSLQTKLSLLNLSYAVHPWLLIRTNIGIFLLSPEITDQTDMLDPPPTDRQDRRRNSWRRVGNGPSFGARSAPELGKASGVKRRKKQRWLNV